MQLVKEFPAFHGTRRFITALTSVRHLSLSWASPIQSIYTHPTSWRSVLILPTHLSLSLPSGLLPSGFINYGLITEEYEPTRCHLLLYCTSYRLNMFRALLCASSGARDYNVDYHIAIVSGLQAKARGLACSPDTTPAYPHLTSNTQQPKNETTNVVISIIVASS